MAGSPAWRTLVTLSVTLPLTVSLPALSPAVHAGGNQSGSPLALSSTPLSGDQVQRLAQQANQKVIVLLRNQHPELVARGNTAAARVAVVSSDQAPILSELAQLQAPQVHAFRLINAVAATVSPAEAARLAANPLVQAVVPDRVTPRPRLPRQSLAHAGTQQAVVTPSTNSSLPVTCPADPAKPLLEPQALQLTNDAFSDPTLPQAQNLVDGKGVRVAFLADGIDPKNQELTRADGVTPVIVDYQDFSGDGPPLTRTVGRPSAMPAPSPRRAASPTTSAPSSTATTPCRRIATSPSRA